MGTQWGYIDRSGAWLIEPAWNAVGVFSDDRAWVVENGKVGYIDGRGDVVIEPVYENAWPFSGGLAKVARGPHDTIVIDREGAPRYADRKDTLGGLVPVCVRTENAPEAQWGVVDDQGAVVVPLAFREVSLNAYAIWGKERDSATWHVFSHAGELLTVHRIEAPCTFLAMVTRVDDWWVLTIRDEVGARLLIHDADFALQHELRGNVIRPIPGTGIYAVTNYNDDRVPEAGIFPGAPTTAYFDASFRRIEPPELPASADCGPRAVSVRRQKEVWFGDERVDGGPFDEAHIAPPIVWVAKKVGKRKLWGVVGPEGWRIEAEHPLRQPSRGGCILGDVGRVGLVDGDGRWVLPPTHTALKPLSDDRVGIYLGGKAYKNGKLAGGVWRLCDRNGEPVRDETFADLGDAFSEGRLAAARARGTGAPSMPPR